jgi:hypothetical protein
MRKRADFAAFAQFSHNISRRRRGQLPGENARATP